MSDDNTITTGTTLEDCLECRNNRRERLTCAHVICAWLTGLALGLTTLALASLVSGCIYKGAKITEGTDLAVGLTIPGSEGAVQINALNWLSGFRLGVAENARLTVKYTHAETNSYLGVVTTRLAKSIDATVEPCEVSTQGASDCAANDAESVVGKVADDKDLAEADNLLDNKSQDATSK